MSLQLALSSCGPRIVICVEGILQNCHRVPLTSAIVLGWSGGLCCSYYFKQMLPHQVFINLNKLEAQEVNFKSQGLVHFIFFLKRHYRNLIVYELNRAYKVDQ